MKQKIRHSLELIFLWSLSSVKLRNPFDFEFITVDFESDLSN